MDLEVEPEVRLDVVEALRDSLLNAGWPLFQGSSCTPGKRRRRSARSRQPLPAELTAQVPPFDRCQFDTPSRIGMQLLWSSLMIPLRSTVAMCLGALAVLVVGVKNDGPPLKLTPPS